MTSGFKVTSADSSQRPNLWSSQSEALVALLAANLSKTRGLNPLEVCQDLNYTYLKKRKVGSRKNYGPTKFQRIIISNEGY